MLPQLRFQGDYLKCSLGGREVPRSVTSVTAVLKTRARGVDPLTEAREDVSLFLEGGDVRMEMPKILFECGD